MNAPLAKQQAQKSFGLGMSKSAARRRAAASVRPNQVHAGRPGEIITMARGRQYEVAPDGSFRRIKAAA